MKTPVAVIRSEKGSGQPVRNALLDVAAHGAVNKPDTHGAPHRISSRGRPYFLSDGVDAPLPAASRYAKEKTHAVCVASALAGVRNATDARLAEIEVVSGVPYDQPAIRMRMADVLARNDGLVFVGGQRDNVTPDLAATYPDRRFAVSLLCRGRQPDRIWPATTSDRRSRRSWPAASPPR